MTVTKTEFEKASLSELDFDPPCDCQLILDLFGGIRVAPMRQARALGCEHAVLQSPNLVLPETPLQHQYQPVLAVQTVGAPAQTSLAADMKPDHETVHTHRRDRPIAE